MYLVVILDLFSRKVVGWSLGDRLDAELAGEALRQAIARRQPGSGLLFHSDRGSEFAAGTFRRLLAQIGAVQSMSRKGDCWDNAVAESFCSTLEFEGPRTTIWPIAVARTAGGRRRRSVSLSTHVRRRDVSYATQTLCTVCRSSASQPEDKEERC